MEVYATLKFALSITLCLFRLFLVTAGMPSKGSSYTLNGSVPGRGISGLASRLAFPLFYIRFHRIGAFFVVLFLLASRCRPKPLALHGFPCRVASYLESCKVSSKAF